MRWPRPMSGSSRPSPAGAPSGLRCPTVAASWSRSATSLAVPMRIDVGQYNDDSHQLTRLLTNPKKAADALQWAVREMDRRYDLLAEAAVRDITGYHEKFDRGMLEGA